MKCLTNFWFKYLLVGALFLSATSSYASHAVGIDIAYECLGANEYRFTVNFYRDCDGISAPGTASINISSASCGISTSITLPLASSSEVSPICPAQFGNSTCSGGSLPGIEQYVYSGNYTLPVNCNDWVIGYGLCCRNSAITNLTDPQNQNIYAQATLDNTNGLCNNSPIFTTLPVPYLCAGQDFNYNHGAIDIDGDSLVYTLVNAQDGPGVNIPYNAGFSPTNPMSTNSGFGFDNNTGQMSFNAQGSQQAVVTILVREYRNGVLIGSTIRDLQLVVLNCSNIVPTATGIDGNTYFSVEICAGFPLCFNVLTNDVDVGQSTSLTWNNGIPGGTFTVSGSPIQSAVFCWTPTPNDAGLNNFSVTVVDDACPIPGTNTYTYTIEVIPNPNPPIDLGPDLNICADECIQLNELNNPPGVTSYSWSPSTNLSASNIPNPIACPSVTTIFTLSATYADACVATDEVQVTIQPNPSVDVYPSTSIVCAGSSIQLTATSDVGSTFQWSTGDNTPNVVITPASDTLIYVEASNIYGCKATDSAFVTYSPPPPPQVCNNIYVTTNGNGSGLSSADPTDLLTAISLAQCNNLTIKVAQGTYIIDNPISVSSLLTIEGGYDDGNNWVKSSLAGATTIFRSNLNPEGPPEAQRLVAIYANGANFLRLQDLTIQTADGVATGQEGMTVYGIHMTACANYDIVRCQIIVGNASAGASGVNGVDGSDGPDGATANGQNGGAGGGNGGDGGDGGDGGFGSGDDGDPGSNGGGNPGSGGTAGNGGTTCPNFGVISGGHGGDGADGTDGMFLGNGGNGGAAGFASGFFIPGTPGQDGQNGTDGTGGGGGGGGGGAFFTDGGGGGGGGGGGTGGTGGTRGYGGGGAFGVYLFNNGSNGNFVDCNITAGVLGAGGTGGLGSTGGIGGNGGAGNTSGGCDNDGAGGAGGNGGDGGFGGDGMPGLDGIVQIDGGTNPATQIINVDLASQPAITAENISCANTPIDFSSNNSGNWNLGVDATPQSPTGSLVTASFSLLGRKNIDYTGEIYTGFHNIAVDNATFLPEITSTANVISVSPDTFLVCIGEVVDFGSTTPAINYRWDFGGAIIPNTYTITTPDLTGLAFAIPGTYTITLEVETDCCGWSLPNDVVLIVEPAANIIIAGDSFLCPGESTVITLSGSSSFIWVPNIGAIAGPVATVPLNPSATTSYQISAVSPSGFCASVKPFTITVNDNPLLSTSSMDASCTNDGSATVTVTNGSGSYDYLWDDINNQTVNPAVSLASGNYNVTVTDQATGCTNTAFVNVGTTGPLVYIQNSTNVTCFGGNDGAAIAAGTGGIQPYTFLWDNLTVGMVNTGLAAGEYDVTLTDDVGCQSTVTAFISQPDSLFMHAMLIDSAGCLGSTGGSAFAVADGGSGGYVFEWFSDPNLTVSIGQSDSLFNIPSGSNYVQVTDNNGCTVIDSIYIARSPSVMATLLDSVLCFSSVKGRAFATASGGTGSYIFEWFSDPNLTITVGQSDSLLDLSPGSYYVQVTDVNGCTGIDSIKIAGTSSSLTLDTVLQNPGCAGGNDGQITVIVTGGAGGFSYLWDTNPVQIDSIGTGFQAGTYRVDITDAKWL